MYPNIILNLEVSRSFKDSTKNINGLNFDLVNALLPPFLHKKLLESLSSQKCFYIVCKPTKWIHNNVAQTS